jgi:hypothetical protein
VLKQVTGVSAEQTSLWAVGKRNDLRHGDHVGEPIVTQLRAHSISIISWQRLGIRRQCMAPKIDLDCFFVSSF